MYNQFENFVNFCGLFRKPEFRAKFSIKKQLGKMDFMLNLHWSAGIVDLEWLRNFKKAGFHWKIGSIQHFRLKIYLPNMASKATTDELGVNFGVEGFKYLLGKDEGAKSNGFLNS